MTDLSRKSAVGGDFPIPPEARDAAVKLLWDKRSMLPEHSEEIVEDVLTAALPLIDPDEVGAECSRLESDLLDIHDVVGGNGAIHAQSIIERVEELKREFVALKAEPFLLRAADRLYAECERAVREGRIDARSPIGDATLDYREIREEADERAD